MIAARFQEMDEPAPVLDQVAAEYVRIEAEYDSAESGEQRWTAIEKWDRLRRQLETWQALVKLRFNQDTRNDAYKQAHDLCDALRPKLTELAVHMKRKLLADPRRDELVQRLGSQAFALWEADIKTFDPAIKDDLVREAQLEAAYVELLASAQLEFQGATYNLSSLAKFHEHPERHVRHESLQVKWNWFGAHCPSLDDQYDQLVKLRAGMARQLGFQNFIGLGYERMSRIDYDQADVERFREAVRREIVPLATMLRRQQAETLGVDPLMAWDEPIYDPRGNPAPAGDHDWMLARAREMFGAMGHGLDEFYQLMVSAELMDLKTRDGKAGGGFCTSFPRYGVPFIFANFNGTGDDVRVFTHEMGHAFQNYRSRRQPILDYLWPTSEACEIHSMSLEYLTFPHMEQFFGGDARRFRTIHLAGSLLFLPYGVAVDHFQHLVYANPDATPHERHAMWKDMERIYLPWRHYGDLEHPARGGAWQFQRHIYLAPFYYIDYTLALTCALQFWVRAERDPERAIESYVALCDRGGEAPFRQLVRAAGLVSPFDDGCLSEVASHARAALAL